jgi:predicted HNH restriction endonuclease
LWPVRTVDDDDIKRKPHVVLLKRLARDEFNAPVLEEYQGGNTFFGMYEQTRKTAARLSPRFQALAVAFFEDVARSLPGATEGVENETHMASHIRRERSRLLAEERKEIDDYECQVCGFSFEKAYGRRGIGFAEAHHLSPLGRSRGPVQTKIEDLVTVCANCHRMLDRMAGKRDDIKKLKDIVDRRRSKRR